MFKRKLTVKKLMLLALAMIMAAVLLAGCGGAPASATGNQKAAAKKEITVYTALENEQIDKYLKSFQAKYPDIEVKIVRDSTGIITAKLLAEGANTAADLVWGTAASSLLALEEKGMLTPYAPKGAENIQPQLKDTANPPLWVGIDAWETAIVVNTQEAQAKNLPKVTSYQDLLKPEFKGQVVMSNPNSSGTGFLAVTGILQLMGEKEGFLYLDKLHENIAMYTHSGSAPAKKAGAGEFAVGISYGYAGVSQLKKGYPVEIVFPAEGSGWDIEANALIKKDNIKEEAKLFLDWAISMDAMNDLKADYAITGIKMGDTIPEGYSKEPIKQLIANNDLKWAAKNRDEILKNWMSRYDGKTEAK
jgi:iron(III) transport system substrate-binding protein